MTEALPVPLPDTAVTRAAAGNRSPPAAQGAEAAGEEGSFSTVLGGRMEVASSDTESASDETLQDSTPDGKDLPPKRRADADLDGRGPAFVPGLLIAEQAILVSEPVAQAPAVPPVLTRGLPTLSSDAEEQEPQAPLRGGKGPGAQSRPLPGLPIQGLAAAPPASDTELELDLLDRIVAGATQSKVISIDAPVAGPQTTPLQAAGYLNGVTPTVVAMYDGYAPAINDTLAGPSSASATISVPPGQPGWDKALSNRVLWLVNQNTQTAQLQINPPQLGPLEVRVSVNQDQASLWFTSQHTVVRDALDAAIPRLREAFAEQGLTLVDVNVSQHSFAQHRETEYPAATENFPARGGEEPIAEIGRMPDGDMRTRVLTGLIDYFV